MRLDTPEKRMATRWIPPNSRAVPHPRGEAVALVYVSAASLTEDDTAASDRQAVRRLHEHHHGDFEMNVGNYHILWFGVFQPDAGRQSQRKERDATLQEPGKLLLMLDLRGIMKL
jgi:hypothetical protein